MQFPNAASEFVYVRTYSRWLPEKQRRETWQDTVQRFVTFLFEEKGNLVPPKVLRKITEGLSSLSVMPSMRALWTAGQAARFDNTCMFNCAFQCINSVESFAECLYILMCGTGYGFSVELKYISKLPEVPENLNIGDLHGTFSIEDSKKGWADSVKILMDSLYNGLDIGIDYSQVRPRGSKLEIMGGRASGPEPLANLHEFIRNAFETARGRQLTPLECHDILNQIAEIVVVGGVRRSSEISLSDLEDQEMANAKIYPFPHRRAMANNSAVFYEKPTAARFLKEWTILANSGTGERGIFNLGAARKRAPSRRKQGKIKGTNPCAEISLRDREFCNLSEVVARPEDTLDDLLEKVETATWLGVIQSTFTHFPYLDKEWADNCNEERLLGVSITGQMDNPELFTDVALKAMKARAIKVARRAAKIMGIPVPASITCVKPSGTVSQLVDSASGVHPRYSDFYIRRYRISATDPLFHMLKEQGMPISPENGERQKDWNKAAKGDPDACTIYDSESSWSEDKVNTWVVSFPIKSPAGSIKRDQVTALEQLEHYKKVQQGWCEHNASTTIYVKDEEWFEVGNWVYKNWDYITGVSFLPFSGHLYEQAPYEEMGKAAYDRMVSSMPTIDYNQLTRFENGDYTSGAKSYSCTSGSCEL